MADGLPTSVDDAEAIWKILQEECDAPDDDSPTHMGFIQWLAGDPYAGEFRFMGALGFGGKFKWDGFKMRVDQYEENETEETKAMIAKANERLQPFTEKYKRTRGLLG